jgi:hypothetical protein
MKELTVQELINELLAGITEGKIDGNSVVYIPGVASIKSATDVIVGKVGNGHRVVISSFDSNQR